MTLQSELHVRTDGQGGVSRRWFLRSAVAGAAGLLGWQDLVKLRAEELRQRGLSCILLWMGGGPSQYESFDPKPGHECMGPTKIIETNVKGLPIANGWPNVATVMDQIAVVRSMTGVEPDHPRATFH